MKRRDFVKFSFGTAVVPLDIQTVAANRSSFVVGQVTEDIITIQQGVADRFFKLGLIPNQIAIRDIVWRNLQT